MTHLLRSPKEIAQAATHRAAKSSKATTKTTARLEINSVSECPICHTEMILTEANGIPVHACLSDRIVLPTKDTV